MGFSAGYLASITINSVSYEDFTSSATLSTTREALDRTKLGESRVTKTSGLGDGSLDVQLHLDTTVAAAIEAAYQATVPIAFVFRAGALGTTDMGQHTGDAIIVDRSIAGDADGEWDCSLSLECTGDITYTAPV